MRQDHRIALLLDLVDPVDIGRMGRPLDGRDMVFDLLVERRGRLGDLVGIGEIRHGQHAETVRRRLDA